MSGGDPPPPDAGKSVPRPELPRSMGAGARAHPSAGTCSLLLSVTNSTANLGRSLVMDQHGFSKLTINLTQSVSGAVGLCLSVALGWLSDRVGRRWVLVGSYALTGAAFLVLGFSRRFGNSTSSPS